MLSIGVFGDTVGFIYNGNPAQSIAQISTIVVVAGYSFAATTIAGWLLVGRVGPARPQPYSDRVIETHPSADFRETNQPA